MATPPLKTEISDTYPNPTNAVARSGFGKLYDYVTGLLGSTGDAPEARAALSVPVQATRIDVASVSGTINLTTSAPNSDDIKITGTLPIDTFTIKSGRVLRVTAGGAFTLVNGSPIVTNTGANIIFSTGETFMLRATADNIVEVLGYNKPLDAVLLTGNQTVAGVKTFSSPIVSKTAAKAWVKFDGTTGAISASHGVASITKVSAGVYTVNFSPAFSSVNYAYSLACGNGAGTSGINVAGPNSAPTTTTFSFVSFLTATNNGLDVEHVSAIFYE